MSRPKQSDYHRVEVILDDLRVLHAELDTDEHGRPRNGGGGNTNSHGASVTVASVIHEELTRLTERVRTMNDMSGERNADKIRLRHTNGSSLRNVQERLTKLVLQMNATFNKEHKAGHGDSKHQMPPAELAARGELMRLQTLLTELVRRNSHASLQQFQSASIARTARSPPNDGPDELELDEIETVDSKRRQDRKQSRRTQRSSAPINDSQSSPEPLSQEEQQFMQEYEASLSEQDTILEEISQGVDDLKQIALDMKKELSHQLVLIDVVESKVDAARVQLKTFNQRLQGIITSVRGTPGCQMCWRMFLLFVLLALVLYAYKTSVI
jgi:hypothetical protein